MTAQVTGPVGVYSGRQNRCICDSGIADVLHLEDGEHCREADRHLKSGMVRSSSCTAFLKLEMGLVPLRYDVSYSLVAATRTCLAELCRVAFPHCRERTGSRHFRPKLCGCAA